MLHSCMIVNPVRDTDDVFDDSSYWTGSDNSDDFKDCYIVAADYMKQSVDEVDAMEGEIACVIDHTQKGILHIQSILQFTICCIHF